MAQALQQLLVTVLSTDEDMVSAFGLVAGLSVGVWGVQQIVFSKKSRGGPTAADEAVAPARLSRQAAKRLASLNTYDKTSITNQELSKLTETPEFKQYWAANSDRILERNLRAFRTPYYISVLIALAVVVTLAYAPFSQKVDVPAAAAAPAAPKAASKAPAAPAAAGSNDGSTTESAAAPEAPASPVAEEKAAAASATTSEFKTVALFDVIDVRGSLLKFFGQVPLKTWLTSCSQWCEAVPLIMVGLLIGSLLTDTAVSDLVCVTSTFVLLVVTHTLYVSFGVAALAVLIVYRLMR